MNKVTTRATTASTGALPTYAELQEFMRTVPPQYRSQGVNTAWLMSDSTFGQLRAILTSTGFPLLWPANDADSPDLLGYPVKYAPSLGDATAGTVPILFGAWDLGFAVRQVRGLQFRILNEKYFPNVAVAGSIRLDSHITQAVATAGLAIHA